MSTIVTTCKQKTMTDNKREIAEEVYDSALYTLAAVGISMATKKLLKENLSTPETAKGILKLTAAIAGGTVLVKYAQQKGWVPRSPFPKK